MTSNTFIKIKRPVKPVPQPEFPEAVTTPEVEPTQLIEIEQPEQPVKLESLAETTPDQSVFGCGWSVTELLNEFSGR